MTLTDPAYVPVIATSVPNNFTVVGNLTVGGTLLANGVTDWANVKASPYNAVGNGVADDTTAIQAAINAMHNAGGGVVYFPAGTYLISAALTIYTNVSLIGAGINDTVIKQSSTSLAGITGVGLNRVSIRDLKVLGPGSGSGIGIFMSDNSGVAGNFYIKLDQVWVEGFGSHGFQAQTLCVSNLTGVVSKANGGHGFFLDTGTTGGTSVTMLNCYATTCTQAGYYLNQHHYSSLSGCAADSCGTGYYLDTCQGITLTGCGCESTVNSGGLYTGTGYKLTGGNTCGLINCYNYKNLNTAVWLTGGQNLTQVTGFRENTPTGTATVGIQVDATCSGITVTGNKFVTAQSIPTPSVSQLPQQFPSPMDHGFLAWNNDPSVSTTASTATVAGTVYLAAIYVRQPITITKLWYCVNAAGSGPTANQNQIGIYNSSGTLLQSVVIDSTITANGPQSGTITATNLTQGFYWVAVVFNATGQPSIGRTSAAVFSSNTANQTASIVRWATNGTLQTSLPGSITPASNSATGASAYWVAVS